MKRPGSQFTRSSERGFVIVAVLWLLVALSVLVTIFSVYLSNSARALGATDIGVEQDALMSASLELTAYQLLSVDDKVRPAQGTLRFRMDNANVSVTYISEAARVDLNHAKKEVLAGLFEVLGAPQKKAVEIADRVVGWRTEPDSNGTPNGTSNGANNDEGALYLAAGLNYSPRQASFAHVDELSLVLGVSPALVERALPYLTVFSKSAGVDVLVAAPEVIAALPGMTPEALADFLKQRPSLPRDEKVVAAALGPAKDAAKLPDPTAFRVVTTMQFDNGRRAASEAVILLGKSKGKDANAGNNSNGSNGAKQDKQDKEPYRVLSWQDQLDTGNQPIKQAGR